MLIHILIRRTATSTTMGSSTRSPPRARSIKDLPTDVTASVLERLGIVDRVRFGSSCSSFNSVFRAHLHLSSCTSTSPPWMVLPGESSSTAIAFFSISDGRIYRIPQKDPCRRRCRRLFLGSSDGWLVTLDQGCSQLYLLNPIAGTKLHLPPLPSSRLLSLESSRAILSWNSSSYKVVLLLSTSARHSPSSACWPTGLVCTSITTRGAWTPFGRGKGERYADAAIGGGEGDSWLYAMRSDGTVEKWDLAGEGPPSLSATIVMPKSTSVGFASFTKHLVVVRRGGHGLVQVWRSREFAEVEFRVFRLEEEEEGEGWAEVRSLDGGVLFLNSNCASSVSMDCCRPPEELRSASSSIYFHCLTTSSSSSKKSRESMVYGMEDGSVERILLHGSIWEPPPIWFAPTLLGTVDSSAQ